MEKVFLRVYNREIEGMIEGGQLDEAVAHCQHILKTYPMHLETYRLLGKSFLEARRYLDAADIFERVLMAVPDDFVSHVGMSIIRDDQGRLDDAIWHMERAFEVQPSNSAIQGELRRLFGRRDGVEPSKIRLSRDALANMYSQGELFNQAIAEIRSILADDQNRPDLLVMLARVYYRSGQKVEAAEIAASLLKKYPYCMDALRILVDVLPGTARADNAPVYRNRLQQLDPYSSYAIDSVFASEKVADSAVELERLDYRSGAMPPGSKPDWSTSLGIKVNSEKQAEPIPEWMQSTQAAGETAPSTPAASEAGPAPVSEASDSDSAIPEWMRSAGWLDSTGKAEETPANTGEEPPQEPIAKAEIPEWLMSMAPAEAGENVEKEPEEPVEPLPMNAAGLPDWLTPIDSAEKAEPEPTASSEAVEPQPVTGEDLPDWFTSIGSANPPESEQPASSEAAEPQPVAGEDLPDWFTHIDSANNAGLEQPSSPEAVEPQPIKGEDLPDWLNPMGPADNAVLEQTSSPEAVEPQPIKGEDLPDWLNPMGPTDNAGLEQPAPQEPAEPQPASREDLPDFLKPMAPSDSPRTHPIELPESSESNYSQDLSPWDLDEQMDSANPVKDEQEQPLKPVEIQPADEDNIPDWLKGIAPAASAAESSLLPQETAGQPPEINEYVPEGLKPVDSADTFNPMQDEPKQPVEPQSAQYDDIPDWLKSIAPQDVAGETPVEANKLDESQAAMGSGTPDWLSSMASAETSAEEHPEPQLPVEPQPESLESTVPNWLSSLNPPEPSAEENKEPQSPIEPEPGSLESTVPNWLSSLNPPETSAEEHPEPQLPAESQPEGMQSDLPDWLSSLDSAESPVEEHPESQLPVESQPESMDTDTPDWLSSLNPSEASSEEHMEPQQPVEAQPNDENVPDWLKLIRQKQEETAQPTESELADLPVTPDEIKSALPQEATIETSAALEATTHEEPANDSAIEPPTFAAPIEGAEAFPDFLTGMGARAAAAAAAASEAMNLGKTIEQPVMKRPEAEQPIAEQPAREQPVAEQPSMDQPAAEQPVMEQPVPEQAVAEQALPEQPAPQEPVVQEPTKTYSPATTGEAFHPSGEVKPLNIEDDAMAWLESLAAKQGAKPEELLTNPLDRTTEMPDWLRHAGEPVAESPAPVDQETPRNPHETLPLEPLGLYSKAAEPTPIPPQDESVSEIEELPPSDEKPEMAAPADIPPAAQEQDQLTWLDQLSSSEETKSEEPAVGSIPAQDSAFDWNKLEAEEQPEAPMPEETSPATPELLAEESDITITSWLNKKDVEEAIGKKPLEPPSDVHPAASTEELPDWLKDIEKPAAPVESSKPAEDLPEWLRQSAALDKDESGSEPAMPTWMDENIPVDRQTVPTVPEEWVPAESKPEELPEPFVNPESFQAVETPPVSEPFPASEIVPPVESAPVAEPFSFARKAPVIPPTLKQTGMLSMVPAQDKDAELLSSAQTVLDQNSLNESMKLYSKLVRKGRLLDEVIHDLREAIYRYPVDVIIWQTLGDAYMRANRLQDALDAYTKAEELLR